MITTQNHIIEKVSFEINSKNTESASLINNNISSWFQNDFVTQLELLFDKYNPKNSIIRFKKVRLDFTLENVTDFGAIQREIIYQLEEKIKEHISLSEISQKNEGSLDFIRNR